MESIFGSERATLKKAISQGGEIEATLDRLFALNAIRPATGERTGERTGSSGGQAKAQPRALWSTSFGSNPSGNRRSGSGASDRRAVAPLVIGRPRDGRHAAHAGPAPQRRSRRSADGTGPRSAARRSAAKLPIVLGVVLVLAGVGAVAAVALRGERSFTGHAGCACDARARRRSEIRSQPPGRPRVRRRHAERAAHAGGAERADGGQPRAGPARQAGLRTRDRAGDAGRRADADDFIDVARVAGPRRAKGAINDENPVRGRSPADVEQRRRTVRRPRRGRLGAILAGLVVLGAGRAARRGWAIASCAAFCRSWTSSCWDRRARRWSSCWRGSAISWCPRSRFSPTTTASAPPCWRRSSTRRPCRTSSTTCASRRGRRCWRSSTRRAR